ncbi:hypothetical protein YC2023_085044 [Brassica napus]
MLRVTAGDNRVLSKDEAVDRRSSQKQPAVLQERRGPWMSLANSSKETQLQTPPLTVENKLLSKILRAFTRDAVNNHDRRGDWNRTAEQRRISQVDSDTASIGFIWS